MPGRALKVQASTQGNCRERDASAPNGAGFPGRSLPSITGEEGSPIASGRHGSRMFARRNVSMSGESAGSLPDSARRRYPLEPSQPMTGAPEEFYRMNPKSLRLQLDITTPPPPTGYARPTTAPCPATAAAADGASSSGDEEEDVENGEDSDSTDPFLPKSEKNVSLETTVLFEAAIADDVTYAEFPRAHAVRSELGLLNSIVAHEGAIFYIRNGCIEKAQLTAQDADFSLPSKTSNLPPESAKILQAQKGVPSVLTWDNYSTLMSHSINLERDDSLAVPRHISSQGAVFGLKSFAEGLHVWHIECSGHDLPNISYGIVSKLGTDSFYECKTGVLPPYVACLRPSVPGEHRLHWRDVHGNSRSRALPVPLSSCTTPEVNCLSVVLDFHFKQITFLCNDAELDCVCFADDDDGGDTDTMLGDHTVFAHIKNGAQVQLVRKLYNKFLPFDSAMAGVQNPKIFAGNPYARWGHEDGIGTEATFQLPLALCTWNNSIWVTDCDKIREIDAKTGAVTTHTPIITPHNSQLPTQYFGDIHAMRGKFYVADITNRTVLCVDPATWEARLVLTKGPNGVVPVSAERREHLAELVAECYIYDAAAALFPPVVEERIARLIDARGKRIISRRKSRKSLGNLSPACSPISQQSQGSDLMANTLETPTYHVHPMHLGHIPPAWLFFTDSEKHCVFYAEMGTGKSTIEYRNCPHVCAGKMGESGKADGQGLDARLRHPTTLIADFGGLLLYVADTGNSRIAKIQLVWNEIKRNYTGQVTSLSHSVTTGDEEEVQFKIKGVTGLAILNESATCLLAGEPLNDAIYQVQLQPTFKASGPAFTSPYDHLVMMLKQAKQDAESLPQVPAEHCRALSRAVDLLIGTPNIYQVEYVGGGLDDDVARFLSDTYAPGGVGGGWEEGQQEEPDPLGHTKPLATGKHKPEKATPKKALTPPPQSPKDQKSPRPAAGNGFGSGVSRVLGHDIYSLDTLDFNVFDIFRTVDDAGGVLVQVTVNIFSKYPFFNRYFGGPENVHRLIQFLTRIQAGYHRENPYHNHIHAADVLQTVHWMINTAGIADKLSDVETVALLLSAVVHDYDHPGVNNLFLINTKHDIALHFNDQSVLENHHLYLTFQLLRLETYAILEPFTDLEQKQIRDHMINHVLGTDMKHHFESLGALKARLANLKESGNGKADFMATSEDKMLMLKSMLHAADISNPVKPRELCLDWAERVMKEFRSQGKKEEERDLPVSPFCDKDADVVKCQKGFIDFIVRPIFSVLVDAYPSLKPMMDNLEGNLQHWKEHEDKVSPRSAAFNAGKRRKSE